MRTHIEFRSANLSTQDEPDLVPDGGSVAEAVAQGLPTHGFVVTDVLAEDWGWCVMIQNAAFPLWIGCGSLEYPDGWLCFIQPSKPMVRRWFRRSSTVDVVGKLANALEAILRELPGSHSLRWWSDEEARPGRK